MCGGVAWVGQLRLGDINACSWDHPSNEGFPQELGSGGYFRQFRQGPGRSFSIKGASSATEHIELLRGGAHFLPGDLRASHFVEEVRVFRRSHLSSLTSFSGELIAEQVATRAALREEFARTSTHARAKGFGLVENASTQAWHRGGGDSG